MPTALEVDLWKVVGHLHEVHDAATRRKVRRMRSEYRRTVRLVLEMIDRERSRRS